MSDNYLMAKFAALEDIAELIDLGAGTNDVLGAIQMTLDTPIEKNASEEDIEIRLGIESVCYDFLKTASDYYATMHVVDETEALVDCIEKVAKDSPIYMPDGQTKYKSPNKAMLAIGKAYQDKVRVPAYSAASAIKKQFTGKGKGGRAGQAAAIGGTALGLGLGGYGAYRAMQNKKKED